MSRGFSDSDSAVWTSKTEISADSCVSRGRLWVAKSHRPAFSTSSVPVFAALIARLRPHLWARA